MISVCAIREYHINYVQRYGSVYDMALLAAGGALKAAGLAFEGEPAFGLIRPPGHHASADSCWGFCFFNNMAIAIAGLKSQEQIKTALMLDFDLHFGDGTANIFEGDSGCNLFPSRRRPQAGFRGPCRPVFGAK